MEMLGQYTDIEGEKGKRTFTQAWLDSLEGLCRRLREGKLVLVFMLETTVAGSRRITVVAAVFDGRSLGKATQILLLTRTATIEWNVHTRHEGTGSRMILSHARQNTGANGV